MPVHSWFCVQAPSSCLLPGKLSSQAGVRQGCTRVAVQNTLARRPAVVTETFPQTPEVTAQTFVLLGKMLLKFCY